MRENSATTAKQRSGLLSVVLPAYNEEATLFKTAKVIPSILDAAGIPFEIVFVSDGSKDGTWDEICAAAAGDPRIRGVRFSRNFGKEAAVFAGLAQAKGDCTAVMDCDLQHPPEKLIEMYRLWQQGYDVVEGVKRTAAGNPRCILSRQKPSTKSSVRRPALTCPTLPISSFWTETS